VDLTGDPAIAPKVSAALAAGGYTVGHVTSSAPAAGTPPQTAIEYPAAQLEQATGLADALSASRSLRVAPVNGVTLLLTSADPLHLIAALTALPPVCAPASPTP
jgi:hypothetical protein